jgi:hypothetical protein
VICGMISIPQITTKCEVGGEINDVAESLL